MRKKGLANLILTQQIEGKRIKKKKTIHNVPGQLERMDLEAGSRIIGKQTKDIFKS